jgi:hypothetical protein
VQTLAADLDLPLQSGEIVLGKIEIVFVTPEHDKAFDDLRQQELVVEGHIRPPVLQIKHYPDSHKPNPFDQKMNLLKKSV